MMIESQQTPAKYFFFTFEGLPGIEWSPIARPDERFKVAELPTLLTKVAELPTSRTKTAAISTGDLAPLEASLIHHWRFDSDYGDSKLAAPITFIPQVGTPPFVAGKISNGIEVEQGVAEYLLATGLNGAAEIDGGGDFSVSGWAKQNVADCNWYLLYSFVVSPFASAWIFAHFASTPVHLFRVVGASGWSEAKESSKITDQDVWIFQAGVWDDSAEQATYYFGINGGTLQIRAGVQSGWSGPRRKDSDALRCAVSTIGNVTLDQHKLWNVALTPAQVAAHYAAEWAAA